MAERQIFRSSHAALLLPTSSLPKPIQPNRSPSKSTNSNTALDLRDGSPDGIFLRKSWTEWSRSAASRDISRSAELRDNYCDNGNSFATNIAILYKRKSQYFAFQQPRQRRKGSIGVDLFGALRAVFQNMVSAQRALPSYNPPHLRSKPPKRKISCPSSKS